MFYLDCYSCLVPGNCSPLRSSVLRLLRLDQYGLPVTRLCVLLLRPFNWFSREISYYENLNFYSNDKFTCRLIDLACLQLDSMRIPIVPLLRIITRTNRRHHASFLSRTQFSRLLPWTASYSRQPTNISSASGIGFSPFLLRGFFILCEAVYSMTLEMPRESMSDYSGFH